MRILAIDPGYERLGVAILDKEKGQKETLIFSDCFKTDAKELFEDRLTTIGIQVENLIDEYKPEALSIENLFISNNQKTAMRVAEVRGMLIYICRKNKLSIKEFTPLQVKLSVTGDGKSSKDQVIKMVKLLVKNVKAKALDDEYDAVAVGLAYFAYSRFV
ncbi:MAG: crossover junction endodeoxyribonuclease RuvC [Candidatus Pacebacteria bacterium]|nr:crossover junction endodeoxyribonuclease RuvC [Candidatus Paceibacterota bacterium]MBP9818416.1 crossover junction endodeoxyribonuclease RuvC [Candidatus Paceibacterota bacterium]